MHINQEEGKAQSTQSLRWWKTPFALDVFWCFALTAVLFVLLQDSLAGGKGLVPASGVLKYPPWNDPAHAGNYLLSDQYEVLVPQHAFVQERLLDGEFPLWNPQLDCGVPTLAALSAGQVFPIQLLFSWMDPFYASGPVAFLKLFLAGWFTTLYVRLLGVCRPAAFVSGTVFALCGFMIVWLGHPQDNCAMWLPLLLYFVEKSFCGPTRGSVLRSWIGFAVAYGCMLLGGHLPTAVHLTMVVEIYFLFRLVNTRERWLRQAAFMVLAVLAGVLVATPQLLPFLEYHSQSASSLASASLRRWSEHLTPNTLIHFVLPKICGNPVVGFEDLAAVFGFQNTENFNETTMYVGILPLFLSGGAIICRRCKFTFFFLATAIGSALVVYGFPGIAPILGTIPVLREINHTRLLLLVDFALAVSAGLGLDTISRMESGKRAVWAAVGFGVIGIAALVWVWFKIKPQLGTFDEAHRAFLLRHCLVFAGQLIAVIVFGVTLKRWNRHVLQAICVAWVAIDLLCFGYAYNPSIPRSLYYPRTPAIEWLQQDHSVSRILGFGSVLRPNTASIYNLSDARGYDFTNVRRYEELITGRAGDFFFYEDAILFPPSFRLLNVKYLLADRPLPLNPEVFDLVYTNEIRIYRYKFCTPRAFPVFDYRVESNPTNILNQVRSLNFDPARVLLLEAPPESAEMNHEPPFVGATNGSVQITGYRANAVDLTASLPRPGFLLLLDTYYPGWHAIVNGGETPIYRADYNFRAVALPAGNSKIQFVYRPASFRAGVALAGATLLTLAVSWFWSRKRFLEAQPA